MNKFKNVSHTSYFLLKLFVPTPILVDLWPQCRTLNVINSFSQNCYMLGLFAIVMKTKEIREYHCLIITGWPFFFFYVIIKYLCRRTTDKYSLRVWTWCAKLFLLVWYKSKWKVKHFVATICKKVVYSISLSLMKTMCCNIV